jgi:4-hydroxybenzoate polyprenyltransferase/phosphoserine phosphatase
MALIYQGARSVSVPPLLDRRFSKEVRYASHATWEMRSIEPKTDLRINRMSQLAENTALVQSKSPDGNTRPLVVDLDGTLLRSDMLIETTFSQIGNSLNLIKRFLGLSVRNKATLKHVLGETAIIEPATLPYDAVVMARIRDAKAAGRKVYLASASNAIVVSAIANQLTCFDGWFASTETVNLKGEAKARLLVETFGSHGFDYIGNDFADLPVWAHAEHPIVVRGSKKVAQRLAASAPNAEYLSAATPSLRDWLKLARVHQYAKNALVFLPLLTSQSFSLHSILTACLGALAFSLCASSTYMFNDLIDLAADRRHPTKRDRPLASGDIPLGNALTVAPVLFAGAFIIAASVSWSFVAVLFIYWVMTTAYSLWLKRKLFVDVVVLASLYTVRVIGGAVAIDVVATEWLLAFSLMIFTCLALTKRYIELGTLRDANLKAPSNRNYRLEDMDIIVALAGAAGFNAITVFCLYISSDSVRHLYRHPQMLWLVTPVLMFWICRLLIMAGRRQVNDDPIVFALHDRISILAIGTIVFFVFISI